MNENHLINNNISILKNVINIYISYKINQWPRDLNTDFTLCDFLFGFVKLTRNSDLNKYKYSGLGIGFGSRAGFSLRDGSMEKYHYVWS